MTLTILVLVVTAVVLIAYDIFIKITKGGAATISWTLYSLSQRYPVIAFALGFVLGHILWVQNCYP